MSLRPHPTKNKHLPEGWTGKKWWQLEFWPDGRKRVNGKDTTKGIYPTFYGTDTEARLYHEECLRKLKPVETPISANPKLNDVYSTFLAWYQREVTAGTVNDFLHAWKHFGDFFGDFRLTYITNALVSQYKDQRLNETYLPGKPKQRPEEDEPGETAKRKPISKRTVNRELSYLSTMIRWAENCDPPLIDPGSVKIKLFQKKQTKRIEPIITHTVDEVQRIIEQIATKKYDPKKCNKGLHEQMAKDRYGLLLLMYDAGLRKSEALKIEGERVNLPARPIKRGSVFDYGTITVIRKGGRIQLLPILTKRLYDELKARLKANKQVYLYPSPLKALKKIHGPYSDIRDGLKSAGIAAKVNKKLNPHLFRHDFVTHAHASGVDIKSISELAGHSCLSTTSEIYSHLTSDGLRGRAQSFQQLLDLTSQNKKRVKKNKSK